MASAIDLVDLAIDLLASETKLTGNCGIILPCLWGIPQNIYIYMLERKKTKSPEMGVIYQFLIINGWCNISGEMGLEATIITRNGRYIFNFINPPQLEVVYSVYCITDLME